MVSLDHILCLFQALQVTGRIGLAETAPIGSRGTESDRWKRAEDDTGYETYIDSPDTHSTQGISMVGVFK